MNCHQRIKWVNGKNSKPMKTNDSHSEEKANSTPSKTNFSRRKFIKASGAAATAFNIVPRHVLGGPGFVPPSEKINIAIIGCGGQGRNNARALFELDDAQIIAVADPVDSSNLDEFYYKGLAGRLPLKAEIEKRYKE